MNEITIDQKLIAEAFKNELDFEKQLTAFKEVYNSLELGLFNPKVAERVVYQGIDGILSEYKSKVTSEIDSSNIKTSRMRAILMQGYDQAAHELKTAFSNIIEAVDKFKKDSIIRKALLKTKVIKSLFLAGNFIGHSNSRLKKLDIGINTSFVTECGDGYDFKYCRVQIYPSDDTYYVYAKVAAGTRIGELIVFTEPKENTPEYSYILWQHGKFEDIKFPVS